MTISTNTALRTAKAQVIRSATDAGTSNSAGQLILMTDSDIPVVTLNLSNPAWGTVSNGVMTLNTVSAGVAVSTNTVSLFKLVDRDGVEVYRGSVTGTGGGGDLTLTETALTTGDDVAISSWQYTESS